MIKPELISPAGDLEKLKIAFQYGADAVYASTPKFSMRTREIGFDEISLKEGIDYAHSLGKKVYLTLNVFPHASEIEGLKQHALKTIALKPDAIIVADPGVLQFVRDNTDIPIHLSTQANTTNQLAADFWYKQGVERIVLARELSLEDIKLISQYTMISRCYSEAAVAAEESHQSVSAKRSFANTQDDKTNNPSPLIPHSSYLELESFVHGAMCMAYSGRCQISNYFSSRDPNKGACVQACRFKYKIHQLEEDLRPGEDFQIYEDDRGSYVLNSRDLCMIEHIPEMIEAGISSFKIEGRLKSIYYVGAITRAYRKAIDLYFDSPKKYDQKKGEFLAEVKKTSSRGFTTGFYFDKPDQNTNNYETSRAQGDWGFVGLVKSFDNERKIATIEAKNYLKAGSQVEIITSDEIIKVKLNKIIHKGQSVDIVHAGYIFELELEKEVPENSFMRVLLNTKKRP
jgi:putative protease